MSTLGERAVAKYRLGAFKTHADFLALGKAIATVIDANGHGCDDDACPSATCRGIAVIRRIVDPQ